MQSSPTIVMRPRHRGRRAAMGALLVAALVGLLSLLMAGNAYAADAKPKPKISKSKPKPKKKAKAKHKKAKHKKAKHKKPKVKGHVKKHVATVIGTPNAETIVLRLKANNRNKIQVDVGNNGSADWQFNRHQVRQIVVLARGGNDFVLIDEANGVFTDTEATALYGEAGNDDLRGGSGAELLLGGSENDAVDGNRGNDIALLGSGDDSFTWDPGDGSDLVEGQAGADTMLFNGNGAPERFEVSANGPRVRFTRDVGNIVMNLDDVERISTEALGGADSAVVNDLSGTDLKNADFDLEAAIGGNAGDGAADTLTVNGTNGDDTIAVAASAGAVDVTGLATAVKIEHSEAANDSLLVNGLGGNDTVNGGIGLAALIKVSIDGGAGNDTINGTDASEVLLGGDGNDAIDGNRGDDRGLLGAGDDSFRWDPGDGSDTIEGQAGTDTMLFNGAGVAESFDVSANGPRVRFFRDVANITMDLDDVENILTQALGGADRAVVNDMSGTDLKNVEFDLEGAIGSGLGDGAADSVTVNGTNGNDAIAIAANAGGVDVTGLAAAVRIEHSEVANDSLLLDARGGNDTVNGGLGLATLIMISIDGGTGDDTINGTDAPERLAGSEGNDTIDGNRGNDVAFLGDGDDTFQWDPGDGNDVIEGQAGTDTMLFNGAGIAENFDVSANGSRVRFFRDAANITMDLDDVETIHTRMLGGIDTAVVNDMSGTDLKNAEFDLAGAIGGVTGDGAADTVTVQGTAAPDDVDVAANAGTVDVTGLAASVEIEHSEVANDLLKINTLAGNDDVSVGAGVAALIQTAIDLGTDE
jgi:Ca2+-binding RTX toxin-like protein